MNKEFIPFEQALKLKELGFDVFFKDYYYDKKGELSYLMYHENFANIKTHCPAPLYQQAFRWFREKYNFCYFIRGNNYDGYNYDIDNLGLLRYKFEIDNRFTFKTYEKAENACLDKLIELVKSK
jgi:hypothetical protein